MLLLVTVINQILVFIFIIVVVQVEHIVFVARPPTVVVHQWLRNVSLLDPGLQRVEVSLRFRYVIKVKHLALILGMSYLNANSAP